MEKDYRENIRFCWSCGKKIDDYRISCPTCGKISPMADDPDITSFSCYNCGFLIPVQSRYCSFCGNKVETESIYPLIHSRESGSHNDDGRMSTVYGAPREPLWEIPEDRGADEDEYKPWESVEYCSLCGEKIRDHGDTCKSCGKKFPWTDDPDITLFMCNNCEEGIPCFSFYCPFCGKKVGNA